jgi:hypothetical protein
VYENGIRTLSQAEEATMTVWLQEAIAAASVLIFVASAFVLMVAGEAMLPV